MTLEQTVFYLSILFVLRKRSINLVQYSEAVKALTSFVRIRIIISHFK